MNTNYKYPEERVPLEDKVDVSITERKANEIDLAGKEAEWSCRQGRISLDIQNTSGIVCTLFDYQKKRRGSMCVDEAVIPSNSRLAQHDQLTFRNQNRKINER